MLQKARHYLVLLYQDPANGWGYIEGNVRQFFYDHNFRYLLFDATIKEYEQRIIDADECYKLGQCKHCTCDTPAKFFDSRACKATPSCYPKMKPRWKKLTDSMKNKLF